MNWHRSIVPHPRSADCNNHHVGAPCLLWNDPAWPQVTKTVPLYTWEECSLHRFRGNFSQRTFSCSAARPPAFLIMFLNRTKATEVFGVSRTRSSRLLDRICFSSVPKFSNSSASSRAAVSDRAVHG